MTEEAKRVIDDMKQAFDMFDKMELPVKERKYTLEYDSAIAIIKAFEQVTMERDAAVEYMRGRCFACANARPSEKIPNMNTCGHLTAAVAVGGYGKTVCDKWQWRGVEVEGC